MAPLAAPAIVASESLPAEMRAEIDWAQRRWSDPMRHVRVRALVPLLLQWVTDSEVRGFISSQRWGPCRHIVLRRGKLQSGKDGLSGKVYFWSTFVTQNAHGDVVKEERALQYERVELGSVVHAFSGGGVLAPLPNGGWHEAGGWGVGDGDAFLGKLSEVTHDVIRYGGSGVDWSWSCVGAEEWLDCRDGTRKRCASCTKHDVQVRRGEMSVGVAPVGVIAHPSSCDACPHDSNPDLERLLSLLAHPDATFDDGTVSLPAIYRSRALCDAEAHRLPRP